MANRVNVVNYVEGDTKPDLVGRLVDVDISGFTIELHIDFPTPLVKTATIDDAENGEFSISWEPTDLVKGRYKAQIEVTDADGKIETFTNLLFVIEEQIA